MDVVDLFGLRSLVCAVVGSGRLSCPLELAPVVYGPLWDLVAFVSARPGVRAVRGSERAVCPLDTLIPPPLPPHTWESIALLRFQHAHTVLTFVTLYEHRQPYGTAVRVESRHRRHSTATLASSRFWTVIGMKSLCSHSERDIGPDL